MIDEIILEVAAGQNLEILFGEEKTRIGHINGNSESQSVSYMVRKRDPGADAVLTVSAKGQRALNAEVDVVVR